MRQYELKTMVYRDLMLEAELEKKREAEMEAARKAKRRELIGFCIVVPVLFFGLLAAVILAG
jgi:hypothetical protein